jgi:hypothetical protein
MELVNIIIISFIVGARGIVVASGIRLQPGTSLVRFSMRALHILICLILPAALGPWC